MRIVPAGSPRVASGDASPRLTQLRQLRWSRAEGSTASACATSTTPPSQRRAVTSTAPEAQARLEARAIRRRFREAVVVAGGRSTPRRARRRGALVAGHAVSWCSPRRALLARVRGAPSVSSCRGAKWRGAHRQRRWHGRPLHLGRHVGGRHPPGCCAEQGRAVNHDNNHDSTPLSHVYKIFWSIDRMNATGGTGSNSQPSRHVCRS